MTPLRQKLGKQKGHRAENNGMEAIFAHMGETLVTVDAQGRIKDVNRAMMDVLGYTKEELIGRSIGKILGVDSKQKDPFRNTRLKELIEKGSVRDMGVHYVSKKGEKIPMSLSGSVLYASAGIRPSVGSSGAVMEGLVCVARDMREIEAFITDLDKAKVEFQEISNSLERRVEERTKDLGNAQAAMINILEDLQQSKEEIEEFSKKLEEKVKERTFELSLLYEISNAISYTLDYERLLKLIMESLFKIVDYDICGALLLSAQKVTITIKPAHAQAAQYANDIRLMLFDAMAQHTQENFQDKEQNVLVVFEGSEMNLDQTPPGRKKQEPHSAALSGRLKSFFNVPFVVGDRTIGMINVSSCKDNAFNEGQVRLMHAIANQASKAIRRLQAVITAEKSKMESTVKSMAEGIIMIDERGQVVVLNPQARRMLGFKPSEAISDKLLHEKLTAVGLDQPLEECQRKRHLVTKEIVISKEKKLILNCEITPVKDEMQHVIGIVTILIDVTKQKELDEMKSEFVSVVSHELRTPLSITTEGINLVLDEIVGSINAQQKEFLLTSRENLIRLNTIINDLLDISKIEAGKIELRKRLVDFKSIINGIAKAYQKVLSTKNQTLQIRLPQDRVLVYIDQDKLIQVITNLLDNAHKFSPAGGAVAIEVILRETDVLCGIKDNGTGIAEEDMPKLFNKFEQLQRTHGPGIKGTGLGLSISKSLVELHGGKIWAESHPGRGSTFFFTLPGCQQVRLQFDHQTDELLREAHLRNQAVTFFVVVLNNTDRLRSKYAEETIMEVVDTAFESLVKAISCPSDQIILYNFYTIYMVLPGVNKAKGLSIVSRCQEAIKACKLPVESDDDFVFQFGLASYPLDAGSRAALIKAAFADLT